MATTKRTAARPTAEDYVSQIKADLKDAWFPHVYAERIRKLRTRSYNFEGAPGKSVEIQHTLLGVELKVGRRRMLCPDLATARYLSLFACAGCKQVAVPYDITKISQLADQLDSSWRRALLLADHLTEGAGPALRSRVRRLLIDKIKEEVETAGAGPASPTFKQTTRQRV